MQGKVRCNLGGLIDLNGVSWTSYFEIKASLSKQVYRSKSTWDFERWRDGSIPCTMSFYLPYKVQEVQRDETCDTSRVFDRNLSLWSRHIDWRLSKVDLSVKSSVGRNESVNQWQ